jgi:hypothetical protein
LYTKYNDLIYLIKEWRPGTILKNGPTLLVNKGRKLKSLMSKNQNQIIMKRLIILLALVSAIAAVYAQNNLSKQDVYATVAAVKMNVLYVGLDNPVSIAVSGKTYDKLYATISKGTITETGNGLFKVSVSADLIGEQVNIDVSVNTNGVLQPVGSYPFRVMGVPKPESVLVGMENYKTASGYAIPYKYLKDFANKGKIGVYMGGIAYDILECTVLSYDVMQSKSGKSISVDGNTFTEELKTLINSTPGGGSLFFDKIKAKVFGNVFMLAPISVTIEKIK